MVRKLLILGILLDLFGWVASIRCYECVYTNQSTSNEPILGMVPSRACLDLNPSQLDDNIHINDSCTVGCKSTHYVQNQMQLVLRGCFNPDPAEPTPCANYTTPTISERCCTNDLCNHGTIGNSRTNQRQTVKCYQCVGSNSGKDKVGMNKYANKPMDISIDCMDKKFNPKGKFIEVNSSCESGCLTGIITDKQGIVYVNRGCASKEKFKCVSGMITGERMAGNQNMKSIEQKCCTTDYCNSDGAYTVVTPKPTTFQNATREGQGKSDKATTVKSTAIRTRHCEWILLSTLLLYKIFS